MMDDSVRPQRVDWQVRSTASYKYVVIPLTASGGSRRINSALGGRFTMQKSMEEFRVSDMPKIRVGTAHSVVVHEGTKHQVT